MVIFDVVGLEFNCVMCNKINIVERNNSVYNRGNNDYVCTSCKAIYYFKAEGDIIYMYYDPYILVVDNKDYTTAIQPL